MSTARAKLSYFNRVVRDTFTTAYSAIGFLGERQASLLAAGLAFFALISLAPFVILAVAIGGAIFGPEATRAELQIQLSHNVGPEVTEFALSLAKGAANEVSLSIASLIGLAVLFWSSMRLFGEVRESLHAIWNLPPPTEKSIRGAILRYLKARLLAALGTLAFGAVFLVLLASRLVLTNIFGLTPGTQPLAVPWALWSLFEYIVSLSLFTGIVYLVYRFLPDRGPRGKALFVGSLITAVLLLLGRGAVGLYVSVGAIGSAYGAAGALIVFLIWAYWSALVFLFGARITYALRERWHGNEPKTEDVALTKA